MFSIADICEIAIQIERNGEETYRQASEQAEDPELAKALSWMAKEEQRHALWFQGLRETNVPSKGNHGQLEAMGRALMRDMLENQTFSLKQGNLTDEGNMDGLISQSIEFENDTILFYEMLRGFLDSSEAVQHLDLIIAEERGHVAMLENFASVEDVKGLGH